MVARARDQGTKAEDVAVQYLSRCGYSILARNFNCRVGEIDIVARQGDEIVFVEVRARQPMGYGTPEETVDARKQLRLRRAAECYLAAKRQEASYCRFDVVAVVLDKHGKTTGIEHIPAAF